jgi:hypothetical protein
MCLISFILVFLSLLTHSTCEEYLYLDQLSNAYKKTIDIRPYNKPQNVSDVSFVYLVNIQKLQTKCLLPIPNWMQDRVHKELFPFSNKKISQQALNITFKQIVDIMGPNIFSRYRIINNKIFVHGHDPYDGNNSILRSLARFSDYYNVPDMPCVDFIVCHEDGIPIEFHPKNFWITDSFQDQAPIFAASKVNNSPYIVCMPDRFTFVEWPRVVNSILNASKTFTWKTKQLKVFWRGSANDFRRHAWDNVQEMSEHYAHQPRFLLCKLSSQFPEILDAGFSARGMAPVAVDDLIKPYMKPSVGASDQLKYAFLVVADGLMPAFTGFLWPLLSNSVVFKQTSNESQWYYDALKPYVHYIPIAHDFSDIAQQYNWAITHQEECRKIAQNSTNFVLENLMIEDLYLYYIYLLQQYEKCQNFDLKELEYETEHNPSWIRIR